MVEIIIFHQSSIFIIIIMFHFLLYVAKGLSSPKP